MGVPGVSPGFAPDRRICKCSRSRIEWSGLYRPGGGLALGYRFTLRNIDRCAGASQWHYRPEPALGRGALVIPGLEGIQGELITGAVPFGETLASLSRRYQLPEDTLVRLNHLTSPGELYAGASLVLPKPAQDGTPTASTIAAGERAMLSPGQSLLELAVTRNTNPWSLVATNVLSGTWSALPGDLLYYPAQSWQKGRAPSTRSIYRRNCETLANGAGQASRAPAFWAGGAFYYSDR